VKNKNYILTFTITAMLILLVIGIINYCVDPFFQYRVKDDSYILNPMYVDAGLIKNYDYNTVVIGSSMTQNYNMSDLRKYPGVKPLKLTKGGLNLKEVLYLYSLIDKDKVNTFIFTIDPPMFSAEMKWINNQFPKYLGGDNILDRLQYLYGYETTVRYTPVDIFLNVYFHDKSYDELPSNIKYKMNIDNIGTYAHLPIYNDAEKVKREYLQGRSVSFPNLENIDARMEDNLKMVLELLDVDNTDSDFIFVLSPYSLLYWYHIQLSGYYSNYRHFVKTFVDEADKFENVKVVCFYNVNETADLNNYADITHFNSTLANIVVSNLFTDDYMVDSRSVLHELDKLDKRVLTFSEENKTWLPAIQN